ncbi:MAG TPA: hypothetical protein VL331_04605 [Croceibacterium sp.]|jgi:hypothetical protein|nr:hypothetical protein [Croceibacterium sp.]
MAEPLDSYDKALAFALTLPGTTPLTKFNWPVAGIAANGQSFLFPGHERDTSFAVAIDLGTVDMLKETEPESYWQSKHYEGYPAVLVRYASPDPERVRRVIEQAREQAAAKRPVRPRKT